MTINGHANGHSRPDILSRLADLDRQYWESRTEREQTEQTYASGEHSRMNPVPRGLDPLGTDADYHYRTEANYFLHVERGRAAVRNHPLVEQGINRVIANLRLDDFTLDVDSGDEVLDADVQASWEQWCGETSAGRNLCDYEGTRSFQQIARQSFFNRCADGDIIHLPTREGSIQTWESHHVRTPFGMPRFAANDQNGIVHGAEVVAGRTVAYWITPFNLPASGSLTRQGQAKRFPVFDSEGRKITFWLGFRHRFFQRRGISRLSAPRDAMTGFEDLNYAHIKSSLRRALISYLMESTGPQELKPLHGGSIPKAGDRYARSHGLGLESVVIEQQGEPAQVFKTPEGYKMEGWNANLPPDSWFEHSALLLTMLAVNLDLPLSFLLLDGSLVNFHGGRMTFDQVKLRMRQIQRDEIQGFWAPIFEWWLVQKTTPGARLFDPNLASAIARGADPYRYTFRPHGWPYVKPAEDVAAEREAELNNLKSRRCILAERGCDLDEVDREIIRDRARALRLATEQARELLTECPELGEDVGAIARELWYGRDTEPSKTAAEIARQEEQAEAAEQSQPMDDKEESRGRE